MSSRSWCYTLNNHTEDDIEQFKAFLCTRHRCAEEMGEMGTCHMQGVITFTKVYKLSGLKKLSRAHWEICKANDKALNYCTKGKIIIEVENRRQGTRTDLHNVTSKIIDGDRIGNLALEYPVEYVKYFRGFEKLAYIVDNKKAQFEKCEVTVLWGPTRSGKTRLAYELDPQLFKLPINAGEQVWFDGYDGDKTLLIDDYNGSISYASMLQICDGHPGKYPIKGGFICKRWNHVIITSNKSPDEWWPFEDNTAAFMEGRITRLENVT